MTRFVVAGAGALGSVVGGLLAREGEDVVLLAHGAHGAALRSGPLELALPSGTVSLRVATAERAGGDVVILTAKRFDSTAALARVEGAPGIAISLQNGAGKNDELVRRFGAEVVAGAATTIAASIVEPGRVTCPSLGVTYVASSDPAGAALAGALAASGIPTVAAADTAEVEWSKLAQVASVMLCQALTALPLHELFASPDAAWLLRRLVCEIAAVGAAAGAHLADLDGMLPVATLAAGGDDDAAALLAARAESMLRAGATSGRTSMLTSIEAGRRTELETIHGELVDRARAAGVGVPVLEGCYRLARLRGI